MYALSGQGRKHFVTGIICTTIASIAVGIRIFCKIKSKAGVRSDDYWMIVALCFLIASVTAMIWSMLTTGGGMEISQILSMEDVRQIKRLENYFLVLFLAYNLYHALVFSIKISILCFYHHLFFIKDVYRRLTWTATALSVMWFLAAEIATFTSCHPIDLHWHPWNPGKCFNFSAMNLWLGSVETFIDLFILAIPIHMAFDLRLPMRARIGVGGIFALGGFSIITNVVRIKLLYVPGTKTLNWDKAYLWSCIHVVTAVICSCLPTYRKLLASTAEKTGKALSSIRSRLITSQRSRGGAIPADSKEGGRVQCGGTKVESFQGNVFDDGMVDTGQSIDRLSV